ncbi:hypothetical protein KQX54_007831 [Cotesia glomerata]|uniref:Uncharacterized protein n=1 Tax=Cotesia glomerata TaxID=32391 RepID=A0AAV7ITC6_COTGL|nr:hypothetical protein KQX54_007831 [Cotesia glomerata]
MDSERCTRTKEELSVNIYYRLKWMMYVEDKMMVVDVKLAMYHENSKRIRRHLEVLLQIHLLLQMDVSTVSEVVKRHTFSCREFQSKFDVPGLQHVPPSFATQTPTIFNNG